MKSARDKYLRKRYGITEKDYNALLEAQEGACAICKRIPRGIRLYVDHSHRSNEVRGLLCNPCNVAVGYLERFSPVISMESDLIALLRNMADYLERGLAIEVGGNK